MTAVAGRRPPVALVLLLACLLLAGCVSIPDSGTVRTGPETPNVGQGDAPFDFNPSPPEPGDSPLEVVSGFLLAMQATPVTTAVAREFLTDDAGAAWAPERRTVVYGSYSLSAAEPVVNLQLNDTVELDARGRWLGAGVGGGPLRFRLRLVREAGEWRISNPPDALLVPRTHFESRFQQFFLYFFDKSAQVLVPEPVYLPRGEQAPTLLVRGLLRGPDQHLLGVERTFIPAGTEYDLSVPVNREGVAEVPLSDEVLDLDPEQLDLLLAQVAWTLRQVSGVEALRVTVDGAPLDLPGGTDVADVDGWEEYDPAVRWASEELFGLRDGRVVTVHDGDERPVSGAFGVADHDLRSIAVDLPGEQVAAVSGDGTALLVAPRDREAGSEPEPPDVVLTGADLRRPAWDLYGQLWAVDARESGAVVTVVRAGVPQEVEAPGLAGRDVRQFRLSRDGTRVVAVVAGPDGDRLVSARVLRASDGSVRRLTRAARLPLGGFDVRDIRDLAWRSPGSVALLVGPNAGLSQILVTRIDGSSALGDVGTNADLFRDEAIRLVTSPQSGIPLYVGTRQGQLFELSATGRWVATSVEGGLRSPTFVG